MTAPRLLCVGDIDMDFLVSVDVLPEFDCKRTGRRRGQWPGGMAANVAVAATRLGTTTRLVGAVGDDALGAEALEGLRGERVDVEACVVKPNCETFTCLVLVGPAGEKALLRMETDAFMPAPDDVDADVFRDVSHVHLNFGSVALVEHCLDLASRIGTTVSLDLEAVDVVDAAARVTRILKRLDLLFVNDDSLRRLESMMDVHDHARAVITTCGREGATFHRSGELLRQTGYAVEAVDSTGAGDCFAAAFLDRWLAGKTEAECLRYASAAAALSVGRHGAQAAAPTEEAVTRFLDQREPEWRETP